MTTDLAADLRTYVAGRRDSKQEQALLRRIRALPQPRRMEILAPLLSSRGLPSRVWSEQDLAHWSGALLMADRAQLTRNDYVVIFKQGLALANASSIILWMKHTVHHIGWRTVISILRDVAAPWPCPGAFALYHMPFLFSDYPLPPSLKEECIQLLELYEREKPLPFLPDSWRNRGRDKTNRPFVFVWGGRQIHSTEFDPEK
jgi:hypothetical protein